MKGHFGAGARNVLRWQKAPDQLAESQRSEPSAYTVLEV